MSKELLGMAVLFAIAFSVGITGLVVLPGAWRVAFASVAGVSFFGLGVTGYAIRTH